MFLFKFLFKKFLPKQRDDNLSYGSNIQRYFSLLSDLLIMILLIRLVEPFFLKIFPLTEENFDILHKSNMKLKLSPQEIQVVDDFRLRYMIFQFGMIGVILSFMISCWHYLGGSIGQILFGLRIVNDKDGLPMSSNQIIKRFFAGIITVATLMIGFLWSLFDKKRQSIHDKIAGTVVVTKKSLKRTGLYRARYDIFDEIIGPALKSSFIFLKRKFFLLKERMMK